MWMRVRPVFQNFRRMASSSVTPDLIVVDGLAVHTTLGASHWPRPGVEAKLQPLVLSITVPHSVTQASVSDNLDESVNYGSLCKVAEACAHQRGKFSSVEELSEGIAQSCFETFRNVDEVRFRIEKRRALLHAQGAGISSVRTRKGKGEVVGDTYFVRELELSTIIGLHPWERVETQKLRVNLEWTLDPGTTLSADGFDFRALVGRVSDFVIASSYQTVESLAASIAQTALSSNQSLNRITVRVGKPSALMMADTAAVQVTRTPADFQPPPPLSQALAYTPAEGEHIAILALGSNLGDRFVHIERALQVLEGEGVKVVDTSFLYETKAMYHEDQPSFINGVCAIATSLSPTDLLSLLKRIESQIGRTPTFRNGPRVVDLDILFYDDQALDVDKDREFPLIVPHVRLREREFVLRPLNDIIPTYTHPSLHTSIQTLLSSLPAPSPAAPMRRVMPLIPTAAPWVSAEKPHPYWTWGERTYVMATLNATPDSFSDGGDHMHTTSTNGAPSDDVDSNLKSDASGDSPALRYALASLSSGAHIIDIGGYSTRPHAAPVSPQTELSRIVPLIKALREKGVDAPLSIDTFRGAVARAGIEAGANWINDIRAGRGEYLSTSYNPNEKEESTLDVSHTFGCPIILMHSREAAHLDKLYPGPGGIIAGVRKELGECVVKALRVGVRRWNIVLDPGYGFSKTVGDNVRLVRELRKLASSPLSSAKGEVEEEREDISRALRNLPILAGTSRKSYLGAIIDDAPAKERDWATAAAVTACVQAGADVVRVHNVAAMRDVVKVADRIWRDAEEE